MAKGTTCVAPKRKASLPPTKPLGAKRPRSSVVPNSSPKTPIFPLFLPRKKAPQDKILPSSQKIKRPPVDSFWANYGSKYIWDYMVDSNDYEMYARRTHYLHGWLGMFVRGLSGDEIAAAFSATTPDWYADAKPRVKEEMERDFEAAYLRLHHKLVNNLNKYAKEWIDSAAGSAYQKAYVEARLVFLFLCCCKTIGAKTTYLDIIDDLERPPPLCLRLL